MKPLKSAQNAQPDTDTRIDELLIPDDNCLKVPGEHCGSCLADFEDDAYSDMNCCSHIKWRDEAHQAIKDLLEQEYKRGLEDGKSVK